MKPKNTLTLDNEFIQYCKLNNIDDVEKFAKQVFDKGFTIIKYGEIPIEIKIEKENVKKPINPPKIEEPIKVEPILVKKDNKDLYDE